MHTLSVHRTDWGREEISEDAAMLVLQKAVARDGHNDSGAAQALLVAG